MLTRRAEKMKSSDESSGYVDERVGPFEQPCKPEELTSSHQQMLEAISQILDRKFATWRHRTQVFKARKATKKYKIRPDLTHRRVKLLQKANGLLANSNDCFAFADINCRLCLKLKDKYRYFSTETQLLEYVKLI